MEHSWGAVTILSVSTQKKISSMKNKKINNKIIKLWDKYFKDDVSVRAPIFYDTFNKNSLLFVGINPSSTLRGHKKFHQGTELEHVNPETYFLWKNVRENELVIKSCIEAERKSINEYRYFKQMHDIAKNLSVTMEHIDLFLYKMTNQSEFEKLIYTNGELNEFAISQLKIFEDALSAVDPKVIVVANAFGSRLVKEYYKDKISYNKNKGWYTFSINNRIVPLFFSSMLSGQRSLDVHSRERLEWHIQKALK